MATKTTNYNLTKPDLNDMADIGVINNNMDAIDTALKENADELEQCFISVSNGKESIASAITDKGIPTENDATFLVMAENIRNIPSGVSNIHVQSFKTCMGTLEANVTIGGNE